MKTRPYISGILFFTILLQACGELGVKPTPTDPDDGTTVIPDLCLNRGGDTDRDGLCNQDDTCPNNNDCNHNNVIDCDDDASWFKCWKHVAWVGLFAAGAAYTARSCIDGRPGCDLWAHHKNPSANPDGAVAPPEEISFLGSVGSSRIRFEKGLKFKWAGMITSNSTIQLGGKDFGKEFGFLMIADVGVQSPDEHFTANGNTVPVRIQLSGEFAKGEKRIRCNPDDFGPGKSPFNSACIEDLTLQVGNKPGLWAFVAKDSLPGSGEKIYLARAVHPNAFRDFRNTNQRGVHGFSSDFIFSGGNPTATFLIQSLNGSPKPQTKDFKANATAGGAQVSDPVRQFRNYSGCTDVDCAIRTLINPRGEIATWPEFIMVQ